MPKSDAIGRLRRAPGLTKLRLQLDQAMDSMILLHEHRCLGADLLSQLRALRHRIHALELTARGESHGYCAWCGEFIRREPATDGHGVKYHVICLAKRRAIARRSAGQPIADGADHDTSSVVEVLGRGTACLPCLVSTTGLPEAEIVDSLRRLRAEVILTVGRCSRCGGGDRLLCGLASA
jgi:hypothetical protein